MHKLKLSELKVELERRGLSTKGTKAELCERLEAAASEKLADAGADPGALDMQSGEQSDGAHNIVEANVNANMTDKGSGVQTDGHSAGDDIGRCVTDVPRQGVGVDLGVRDAVLSHEPVVHPQDSVSLVSRASRSSTSSVRSKIAEEAAKRAELEVRLRRMMEKQKLSRELARLQEEKELLEINEALDVSKAREVALSEQVQMIERSSSCHQQQGQADVNITQPQSRGVHHQQQQRILTTQPPHGVLQPQLHGTTKLESEDQVQETTRTQLQERRQLVEGQGAPTMVRARGQVLGQVASQEPLSSVGQSLVSQHRVPDAVPDQHAAYPQTLQLAGQHTTQHDAMPHLQIDEQGIHQSTLHPVNHQAGERVHSAGAHAVSHSSEEAAQRALAGFMRLPPVEIARFEGDVTEYPQFIRAFDLKIASKLDNPDEKLYYLEQYMVPGTKPHHIVSACIYLQEGYDEARRLLDRRYGQASTVSAAFISRLESYSQIRSDDVQGLDSFGILLTKCRNALSSCGRGTHETLRDPRTLRTIVGKLPGLLINKWRHRVDDIEESGGREATFDDLVAFVTKEARVASNPTYGRDMFGGNSMSRTPVTRTSPRMSSGRAVVTATQVTPRPEESRCVFCNRRGHDVCECEGLSAATSQQKKDFVREKALCWSCLRRGHRSRDCRRRASCRTCGRRHPTSLHWERSEQYVGPYQHQSGQHPARDDTQHRIGEQQSREGQQGRQHQLPHVVQRHQHGRGREPNQTQQQQREGPTDAARVTTCRTAGESETSKPVLPVVPVVVHVSTGQCQTYAFLDSGSTHSFISSALCNELNIDSMPRKQLSLTTVDRDTSVETHVVDGVTVSDLRGQHTLQLPPLFTLAHIPVTPEEFPSRLDVSRWEHLTEVEFEQADATSVGLLLGANAFLSMEPLQVVPSRNGSPYAVRTRFGWILSGVTSPSATDCAAKVYRTSVNDIEDMIQGMYNREYEENLNSMKRGLSEEDKKWLTVMEASKKIDNGHYQFSIPLKDEDVVLPNNRVLAERRLTSLGRRMKNDVEFAEQYHDSVEEMIDKGYAEPVPVADIHRDDGRVNYLAHHGVRHASKNRIRVVYDCAMKYDGVSLNDCLLQGPDMTNSLLDVLMRFRMERVAFMADVESMFNQVRVPESERDLLRFLWWRDGRPDSEVVEYRMTVHIFGAKSSPSVACYALREAATDHAEEVSSETVKTVNSNFYVDDALKSTQDVDTAISLAHDLKTLLEKGGFSLKKFTSNSPVFMSSIQADDRSKAMQRCTGVSEGLPEERALGVVWNTENDLLRVSVNVTSLRAKPLTRRGILSAVSSIYDPLGLVSPTVIRGRKVLQDICRTREVWDKEIPAQERNDWMKWLSHLDATQDLCVPRHLKPADFDGVATLEMHHFSDASEWAYGTVTYARFTNQQGDVYVAFVKGTSHLAPLKKITIPRLELMAAVTAVRVRLLIEDAMELSSETEHFFWTDSTTVLAYVQNTATRFHTFVSNRLAIIHDGSRTENWRFVRGEENPADDSSRGVQSERWLSGPAFLRLPEEQWPTMPPAKVKIVEEDPEVKRVKVCASKVSEEKMTDPIEVLIRHYSKKQALLRAVAWLLKVKKRLQERATKSESRETKCSSRLELADLEEAENCVVRWIQEQSFPDVLEALQNGQEVKGALSKLSPFLSDGILRVGGRLKNADVALDQKHPVVLPDCYFAELTVQQVHERVGHSGRQHVLAEIRRRFWIVKGNSVVRRVIGRCLGCRRRHRPPESQKMADLPSDRVTAEEPVFTRTGVDYFGPFFVKQGRKQVKRYGVVFTCLAVRAVHIEVAENLSGDSFLCALRRFVARRGHVKVLRSDKGTNFVGASRELREELEKLRTNEDVLHRTLLNHGVEWKFNTAAASHHGGVWERQIRSIRRILGSLLDSQTFTEETLLTLLCEVEAILNSRPLTPVSLDPVDHEPLTPNHLLIGTGSVVMPFGVVGQSDSDSVKRWKQARHMANLFWKRWRAEYLPLLQERPYRVTRKRANLVVGDAVLVVDAVPRGQWPLGVVERVRVGADGLVRSVEVKTRGVTLQRPVTKLVKL